MIVGGEVTSYIHKNIYRCTLEGPGEFKVESNSQTCTATCYQLVSCVDSKNELIPIFDVYTGKFECSHDAEHSCVRKTVMKLVNAQILKKGPFLKYVKIYQANSSSSQKFLM